MGDVNLDLLKFDTHSAISNYIDILNGYNFHPLSILPTRVTESSSSLLDHIYFRPATSICNWDYDSALNGCLLADISDHFANVLVIPLQLNKVTSIDRPLTRIFSEVNKTSFSNELNAIDWSSKLYNCTDVNVAYKTFLDILTQSYDRCFPLIRISRKRSKDKKWVTPNIIKSSLHKNRLYKKWIYSKNPLDKLNYKLFVKTFNKELALAKSDYYTRTFNFKTNSSKHIWKNINNLCSFKPSSSNSNASSKIANIIVNGVQISDDASMAESFNQYFCNIGHSLAALLPNLNSNFKVFLPPSNLNSFVCDNISQEEIYNSICKLKSKSCACPDVYNAQLLFYNAASIIPPLGFIYNLSLSTGIFPSSLKIAKTIPIFKKGVHTDIGNYRPISLLTSFSKIFESLVASRLTSFLLKFNILYDYQFGFRSKYSTKLALLNSIDDVLKAQDNKEIVCGIFFDIAKAFDSIDHSILLAKLYNYGFRGQIHRWLSSYLSDRQQFTVINDAFSKTELISHGVPQGSVLGPLLFLIYINDLGSIPNLNASPKLFADDTNIFVI